MTDKPSNYSNQLIADSSIFLNQIGPKKLLGHTIIDEYPVSAHNYKYDMKKMPGYMDLASSKEKSMGHKAIEKWPSEKGIVIHIETLDGQDFTFDDKGQIIKIVEPDLTVSDYDGKDHLIHRLYPANVYTESPSEYWYNEKGSVIHSITNGGLIEFWYDDKCNAIHSINRHLGIEEWNSFDAHSNRTYSKRQFSSNKEDERWFAYNKDRSLEKITSSRNIIEMYEKGKLVRLIDGNVLSGNFAIFTYSPEGEELPHLKSISIDNHIEEF